MERRVEGLAILKGGSGGVSVADFDHLGPHQIVASLPVECRLQQSEEAEAGVRYLGDLAREGHTAERGSGEGWRRGCWADVSASTLDGRAPGPFALDFNAFGLLTSHVIVL